MAQLKLTEHQAWVKQQATYCLFITRVLFHVSGLVMPSFVTTKADMILYGILPIDQMRDHRPAMNALTQKIPR